MNGSIHTIRKIQVLAVVASAAAIAVPAALAGGGLVSERLGSPHPREGQGRVLSPGLTPSTLGLQRRRDRAAPELAQRAPHERLQRSGDVSYDGDYMFRDFFRGTHYLVHRS